MTTLLVFGDSLVWGAWDAEGGWVARLRKEIDKKNLSDDQFYCSVYNLGISGDTSTGLLKRMRKETLTRLKTEDEKPIIIIEIGDNDAAYLKSKKTHQTPIEEFRKNINLLIKQAKKITKNVLFISPTRVDEAKTNPVPWNTQFCYKNKDLELFTRIVQEETEKEEIVFLNAQKFFDEKTMLSEDGLHPNNVGHEKICQKVKEILIQKNILSF